MLYVLLAICGIMSFLAIISRYFPLKLAASFFWLALLVFWFANGGDYVTRGDPTDTILTVAFIFPPIIFVLWGLSSRVGKVEVQDEVTSTGSLIRRIVKYNKSKGTATPQGRETAAEYKIRIRSKLHGRSNRGR